MTISPTLMARTAILDAIQGDASVTALVPAARLYPSKTPNNPIKPFGRYGSEIVEPVRASCWRGGTVAAAYHVFVGTTDAIPDPKSYAEHAVAALADCIDALDDCHVERTQIMEDGQEADVWHGIVQFAFTSIMEA